MHDLEINKLLASVLFAALVAAMSGTIVDMLYHPLPITEHGFVVEVPEASEKSVKKEAPDVALLLSKADAAHGKLLFKKCLTCHKIEKGSGSAIGPNLYGIIENHKAHLGSAFSYSKAMSALKDQKWTFSDLFHFIHKPQKFVPKTRMSFAGISKYSDVADVIAYVQTQADTPVPFPEVIKQELNKNDTNMTNKEHSDGTKTTAKEHSDGTKTTAKEHSNGTKTTAKEHSNGTKTTAKEHSNGTKTTAKEHSDSTKTTAKEHSNGTKTTAKEHSNGTKTTAKEHSNGTKTTAKEHSDSTKTTAKEHSNGTKTTAKEHSNGTKTTAKEHSDSTKITKK